MSFYVGYHKVMDELFIYAIDCNQLVYTFRNGHVDAIFFYEFAANDDVWEDLGEL